MCYVCCKEFKGWFKSFTKIETFLAILEGLLLIVFIVFLVFLILHFFVCSTRSINEEIHTTTTQRTYASLRPHTPQLFQIITLRTSATTVPPGVKCTWTPSAKTSERTRYYENNEGKPDITVINDNIVTEEIASILKFNASIDHLIYVNEDFVTSDQSDGEDAEDIYKGYVLALVKLKPPTDVTFGCILTVITTHWTLTAASCLESIEEVDSLDSFVMMEDYGSVRQGRTHMLSDIQIHPLYQGGNRSYDLAALKSEDRIVKGAMHAVELPSMLDYFLITIGERFIVLGYGAFRTIDKGPTGRSIHKVYVYSLPSKQCASDAAADMWSLRHLLPGEPAAHAPCGTAPLCAGVLYARGTPCNYCAGTPLFHGSVLYGVMSNNVQCGVECEPQLYVNIAVVREWLDFILGNEI